MGRRKAAEAPASPAAPVEVRRSSRLAVKDRVDYNEVRMFKQILSVNTGKETVAPRKTKKEKTKLTRAGSVAVRITHETFTTMVSRGTPASKKPVTSRTESAVPALTVALPMPSIGHGVSATTPVSCNNNRKHMTGPATVEEEPPSMPSTSSDNSFEGTVGTTKSGRRLKRQYTYAALTPDTSLLVSPTALKLRPVKGNRKEKSVSPDELPEVAPRGRESRGTALFVDEEEEPAAAAAGDPMVAAGRRELQPHGTALFVDEEEALPDQQRPLAVEEAAAGAADDTMMAAVDDGPYLVEEPPEVVVPEKKRRKKSTVAKQGTVAEGPDIIFEKIIKAKRGQSIVMERVLVKEELFLKERRALAVEEEQDERDRFDDAFANEFSTASGDIERSLLIADQLTSGTLAIEDLSEEDRILAELFSPIKTPRLDASLRAARPLILSSSSDSGSKSRREGRKAAGKARKRLTDQFDSESDDSPSSPSSLRQRYAPDPDDDAYAKRAKRTMQSKQVRSLFAAASGAPRKPRADEAPAVCQAPRLPQRKKIQYPGIAPLPEDDEEDTVVSNPLSALDGIL